MEFNLPPLAIWNHATLSPTNCKSEITQARGGYVIKSIFPLEFSLNVSHILANKNTNCPHMCLVRKSI